MKNVRTFSVVLAEKDYQKLEELIESGRYRTKTDVISDLIRNFGGFSDVKKS